MLQIKKFMQFFSKHVQGVQKNSFRFTKNGPSHQWGNFKYLVGQNRWTIWKSFGSKKGTKSEAYPQKNFELDLGLIVLAESLGKKRQTNKIHTRFTGILYMAEAMLQEWKNLNQNNFEWPTDFGQLIWVAFEIAQLIWWSNLDKTIKEFFWNTLYIVHYCLFKGGGVVRGPVFILKKNTTFLAHFHTAFLFHFIMFERGDSPAISKYLITCLTTSKKSSDITGWEMQVVSRPVCTDANANKLHFRGGRSMRLKIVQNSELW